MEYMGYRSKLTEEYMAEFCENLIEAIEEYDTEKEIQKVYLDIEDFEKGDFDDTCYLYADKCNTFNKAFNISDKMRYKGYDGVGFGKGYEEDFKNSFIVYDRTLPTKSPLIKY